MQTRKLGRTGLDVSPLTLGTAELSLDQMTQDKCDRLLNAAIDMGVRVIDTAACYGESETKIGQAIGRRRGEYVLVSKCGHKAGDLAEPEWTGRIVEASTHRSLRRLQTDHLDVLLLHSCGGEMLDREDLIAALQKVKREGHVRFIGYSGDGGPAQKALGMGVFDVLETSVNFVDQQAIDLLLPRAGEQGVGVFAKRSVANACWRDLSDMGQFYVGYAQPYAQRLKELEITPEALGFDGSWMELALRFTVYQPGVSSAIVGTRSAEHLKDNVAIVQKGPLPEPVHNRIRQAWQQQASSSWGGLT